MNDSEVEKILEALKILKQRQAETERHIYRLETQLKAQRFRRNEIVNKERDRYNHTRF